MARYDEKVLSRIKKIILDCDLSSDIVDLIGRTYQLLIENPTLSPIDVLNRASSTTFNVEVDILSNIQRGLDCAETYNLETEFIAELLYLATLSPEDTIEENVNNALMEWDLSTDIDALEYPQYNSEQDFSDDPPQCRACPEKSDCNRIPSPNCDPAIDHREY